MKPIQRKDLVIGEVYADINDPERAIRLRHIRKDEQNVWFEYVSGEDCYVDSGNGIGFYGYEGVFYQEDSL